MSRARPSLQREGSNHLQPQEGREEAEAPALVRQQEGEGTATNSQHFSNRKRRLQLHRTEGDHLDADADAGEGEDPIWCERVSLLRSEGLQERVQPQLQED